MSTAVSEIIEDAYRQENILAAGSTLMTTETTEGLRVLNRIVLTLFGHELGESLTPWPIALPQRTAPSAANYPALPPKPEILSSQVPYPPPNSQLMCSTATAQTVYFPSEPQDGARMQFVAVGISATVTLDGNGRLIDGATTFDVDDTTESPTTWLYRGDLGQWLTLATLTEDDDLPFPAQYDDYFVNELAIRLCPRHGKTAGEATVAGRNAALKRLRSRYRQTPVQVNGGYDIPNTTQVYDDQFGLFDNTF
jgi:hypothetical protein